LPVCLEIAAIYYAAIRDVFVDRVDYFDGWLYGMGGFEEIAV